MAEDRSNRAVTYAVVAALGAGGAGATGGTWLTREHQHAEIAALRRAMHQDDVALRNSLIEIVKLVERREAVANYWIERFRELERQLRYRPPAAAKRPA